MWRVLILTGLLVAAAPARAQSATALPAGWELGVRYWFSQGTTRWSHNAQGSDPSLGNPTSILTYEDLRAHAIELHARKELHGGWFLRGNAGLGWIRDGSFDDEDFEAGQVKFSDTTSSVRGNRLTYATIDLGRVLWTSSSTSLGVFAGYHGWTERLDAYGVRFTVNSRGLADIDDSVLAISNEAIWSSLRVGATLARTLGPRTRFSVDVAWLPYARLYNDDSHWLRSDFGPAPNVFIKGDGRGLQLDLELRHRLAGPIFGHLSGGWEVGAGLRYWWIEARNGNVSTVTFSAPLVEFASRRAGLTFNLARRW